jgi:hypothetical protein
MTKFVAIATGCCLKQHAHLLGTHQGGIRLPLPRFSGRGLRIRHVYTRGDPHSLDKRPCPAFQVQTNYGAMRSVR